MTDDMEKNSQIDDMQDPTGADVMGVDRDLEDVSIKPEELGQLQGFSQQSGMDFLDIPEEEEDRPEPILTDILPDGSKVNINMLIDVPVRVTAELGRTRMTVKQILELERGSVIELDRIAGDPIDLFVNDHLIARGEVVIVDDNFGIRITEIISSPPITGTE